MTPEGSGHRNSRSGGNKRNSSTFSPRLSLVIASIEQSHRDRLDRRKDAGMVGSSVLMEQRG